MSSIRILYYLWCFPRLTETFIRREIEGLKAKGLNIDIYSEISPDMKNLGEEAKKWLPLTTYMRPFYTIKYIFHCFIHFLVNKPRVLAGLAAYIFLRIYTRPRHLILATIYFFKGLVLARRIEGSGITHIHCPWSDFTAIAAMVCAKLSRTSYSMDARAFEIYRKSEIFMLPEKIEKAAFVRTNSFYSRDHLNAVTNRRFKEKIHVIYSGLDMGQFLAPKNKICAIEECRIFSVGRIVEKKGFHVLVEALKILDENGIKFKCEIVGASKQDGYCIKLQRLIDELGLKEKCILLGARPFEYVLEKYKEADMFVLPCLIEHSGDRDNLSNALKEAMAMKLPVISTTVSGMPELIDSGKDGILVPANDEKSLASAIIELINNKEKAKIFGENARKKIEEKFDLSKNIDMLYRLFTGEHRTACESAGSLAEKR